jgi:hypothetical protein
MDISEILKTKKTETEANKTESNRENKKELLTNLHNLRIIKYSGGCPSKFIALNQTCFRLAEVELSVYASSSHINCDKEIIKATAKKHKVSDIANDKFLLLALLAFIFHFLYLPK